MKERSFGKHGFNCSEIGFGAWAIGGNWGPQTDEDSLASLHHALDQGVNLIDTAAGYGNGHSERLIGQALRARRESGKSEQILVATKTPPAFGPWPPSPYCKAEERYSEDHLRSNITERLDYLGTDKIDLLQLHTWTRAWNRDPKPFAVLRELQSEGTLGLIGMSTPEHDQNCAIDLIRGGWIDSVQLIYNIFEQEPAAELLDIAGEYGVAVIVRVAFDEGALTGKFSKDTVFAEDDFRRAYFAGDRLGRTVDRVEKIRAELADSPFTMPQAALKFALSHPAVSCVIPGMRTVQQAAANCAVSELPDLPEEILLKLREHRWNRAFWYWGK
jgi:aryl-alcohol dehydrogenase-like predicted oxidoreductase